MRFLRRRARLLILGATLVTIFVVMRLTGATPSSKAMKDWADGLGPFGIPAYVAAAVALNNAFVPFPLLAGVAGAVFGIAVGTPVALAVAVLAAVSQFTFARLVARPRPSRDGRVGRPNDVLTRHGTAAVFYTRLVPGLPYVPLNYAAGLTPLRARDLALGTAAATGPRAFAYAALGGTLLDTTRVETWVAIGLLAAMAVFGVAVVRRNLQRR